MNRLIACIFVLAAAALPAAGQTCTPVIASLTWNGSAPTQLTLTVTGNGAVIVPGVTLPIPGPGTLPQTVCLPVGCYQVTIASSTPLNGDLLDVEFDGDPIDVTQLSDGAQQWVYELCVGTANTDCPDAIDYAAGAECAWAFEIGSFAEGESVVWSFGDGSEVVGGHYVTHSYAADGVYEVTAEYTSAACPDGVVLTTEIAVEGCSGPPPCAFPVVVEDAGCNAWEISLLELPAGSEVVWTLGNAVVGDGGSVVVEPLWDVIMADCAPVVATVNAPGCPPQAVTALVCEEDCMPECPLELTATTADGFMYLFTATGAPEGAVFTWYVDGTVVSEGTSNTLELGFDFNPFWTVCVFYAAEGCAAEACVSSPANECTLEIVSEEVAEGVFVFTALDETGAVWPGVVQWEFVGSGSAEGNPVAWTWPEDEGVVEICAWGVSNSAGCPVGATDCTAVEVNGLACEEVTLVLTPAGVTATGFGMTLTFEADWLGLPLGGWELDEDLECGAGWTGDTLTFCLPPTCFSLEVEAPESAWNGLEALVGSVAGAPVAWTAEAAVAAFGLNPACAAGTPGPVLRAADVEAYPVPASDAVTLAGSWSGLAQWKAVSLAGQTIASGSATSPCVVDVSAWAPGVYQFHVATHGATFMKKVVVTR
jgi:hypothetical protein